MVDQMGLKQSIRQLVRKVIYGAKIDSEHYVRHLKHKGIAIGNGTIFYDPVSNVIDETNPSLLKLGNNVRITHGVVILTHDYSWSVLAGVYGECLGGVAPVTIGDNVFIGINAIITKGCQIGDNVIIGAASVVTNKCDSNSVYAGNPARKIMSLSEFYEKKKKTQLSDIENILSLAIQQRDRELALREYETLFKDYKESSVQILALDTGYKAKCDDYYSNKKRQYNDMECMISSIIGRNPLDN